MNLYERATEIFAEHGVDITAPTNEAELEKIPDLPTTAGTRGLKTTVDGTTKTYSWDAIEVPDIPAFPEVMGTYMLKVTYNSTTEKFEAAWFQCPIPLDIPTTPGDYLLRRFAGGGYAWSTYTSPLPAPPLNPEAYGAAQNFILAHEGNAWSWEHMGFDLSTAQYVPAAHYSKLYFSQNGANGRVIEFEDGGAG